MNENIGFIRHGEKLGVGEARKPIEESGLTPLQQEKWRAAQERLGSIDPEISYAALPKIEALAQEIYSSLPEEALVVFASTTIPRARFTADLLSTEIVSRAMDDNRDIGVSFIWEPEELAEKPESVSNITMYPPEVMDAMTKKVAELDLKDDESLREYLEDDEASTTHPKEDEITFQIMNEDLTSKDSFMKRRAELLKAQVATLGHYFKDESRPVFFYGVGHHSSLIALDVAFNGRQSYESVDDMPKPLSLWKVNH